MDAVPREEERTPNSGVNVVDFWNVNVPVAEQTEQCPEYLEYALENEKDRTILSTLDEHYQRQTWSEIRELIANNRLDLFTRVPSELRLYREYCAKIVHDHGSIMKFVMQERLQWTGMRASGTGFGCDSTNVRECANDTPG